MAHLPHSQSSAAVLFLLLLITSVAGADSQQLNSALQSLRSHGYSLFTNAITTSDLQFELLTQQQNSFFTVFAPKDEMLFALDMATDAAVYVNTLRYHIVPHRRHAFADLQNLSSPFLDTLLPHFAILVLSEGQTVSLMVDGVRVSDPDIFLGSTLAVHGIDGILLAGLNMSHDDSAESPAPVALDRNIPVEEMFQFDRNIQNPKSEIDRDNSTAEGGTSPPSQFDDDDIPSPVNRHFDWRNVPGGLESPKTMQDQLEKLKSLAKKHRAKGRRRHHHHQRRKAPADHLATQS